MAEPYAPLSARRSLLGGIEETTSGTLGTIAAALTNTAIYDAVMEPVDFTADGERRPGGQYGGNYDAVIGRTAGRLTFRQELRNGDAFVTMLTGAGYTLSTSTYIPASSMAARKTWSFALYEDGRRKALAGCAGTCRIEMTHGGRAWVNWEWQGIWQAPTDVALPTLAPNNTQPYVCKAITWTIGAAVPPHTASITIDLGNSIEARESVTASSGIAHFFVSARSPKLTADLEARLVAQRDAYGILLAGTTAALNIVLGTGGNTLTIAAPRAQLINITDGARGGRRIDNQEFQLNASSGDDELAFTQATA